MTTSPLWPRTALVINYDEWGGFFDHVPPATAPDPRPDLATGCAASAPLPADLASLPASLRGPRRL